MRLLRYNEKGEFSLIESFGNEIPEYAILSHTWGAEEVTFKDLIDGTGQGKAGYRKIQFCGEQARRDGLQCFWVDTCCIDKSSSTELAEAINSMFQWYSRAVKCYAYLSDVSVPDHDEHQGAWESDFRNSRWFTRGWTLQELIAPPSVEFFSSDGKLLGDRANLVQQIHEITGIASGALQRVSLNMFSIGERFSWAANRQTTRDEDKWYCLLGIFGVHLPLIYGEGENNALNRLRTEIKASTATKFRTASPCDPSVVRIAVMGVTGAGKSTFISHCVDEPIQIGHTLQSCTTKVQSYLFTHDDGTNVELIDTPGFDDTNKSDVDVLRELAEWLKMTYENNIKLSGIIYLHRITDDRMQGSAKKNLFMFKKLCGQNALKDVILATTKWEGIEEERGCERETELKITEEFWGWMVKNGSQVKRHYNNRESAMRLIGTYTFAKRTEMTLEIQKEMVTNGKSLDQTQAGRALDDELHKQRENFEKELRNTRQMMEDALAARDVESAKVLQEHRRDVDAKLKQLEEERNKLARALERVEQQQALARISDYFVLREDTNREVITADTRRDSRRDHPRTDRERERAAPVQRQETSARMNEYFIPREGIDREVITADVCRYLGNDALVRPGNYEDPETKQILPGYFITAYRCLTSSMIADLKADTERFAQERRTTALRGQYTSNTTLPGDSNGIVRNSNILVAEYRASTTHQSRQYYGPTEVAPRANEIYPSLATARTPQGVYDNRAQYQQAYPQPVLGYYTLTPAYATQANYDVAGAGMAVSPGSSTGQAQQAGTIPRSGAAQYAPPTFLHPTQQDSRSTYYPNQELVSSALTYNSQYPPDPSLNRGTYNSSPDSQAYSQAPISPTSSATATSGSSRRERDRDEQNRRRDRRRY